MADLGSSVFIIPLWAKDVDVPVKRLVEWIEKQETHLKCNHVDK